jgi:beta-glucosidase
MEGPIAMTKRLLVKTLTLVVAAALPFFTHSATAAPAGAAPDVGDASAVWRDAAKTPDQRARDLLARLTLQEKISLLHGDGTFTTAGLPRFNIPKLWMSDGPQGVREEMQANSWNSANRNDDFATALPAGVGLAATFDTELARAFGNVIGEEALTRKKNIMLCPGLNIMRTPLNGRNSEYLGEDPFLSSRMAVNLVEGLQAHGVSACIKHYALNNQESSRGSVNVHVDERTMREIYLPAFKAAVTEAHAWSLMTAYNRVNGQYCSENEFLLNQALKKDWGFEGLVMTDWGGCHSTVNAANHGLDLEMGSHVGGNHSGDFLADPLLKAVEAGQVPMSRIDDMALRNLRVMAWSGQFDPAEKREKAKPMMAPEHIAAARRIAENAIVLLKNEGSLLPIDVAKTKTIAVIGSNAQAKFARDGDSARIKTSYEITPLDGIRKYVGDRASVQFAQGYAAAGGRGGQGKSGKGGAPAAEPAGAAALLDAAVTAAKGADVAIVVAGLYRNQDQEGRDRGSFNLPPGQADLIQAVCKANPRTVVVLNGGSPSSVDPWLANCGALLMYWYGGTEGGNGLARVLFGDVNPAGHLPCTWPKKIADSPAHSTGNAAEYPGVNGAGGGGRGAAMTAASGPQENYSEGILVGYRWFDAKKIEPQFPFGFGLSYTTFALSDLKVEKSPTVQTGSPLRATVVTVTATVANTGARDGAEAVQVYVEQAKPALARPPRELKGFAKAAVAAGQRSTVSIPLPLSAFSYFDPDKHAWVAEAGQYTILVGDSSRNLTLKAAFELPETVTVKEGL